MSRLHVQDAGSVICTVLNTTPTNVERALQSQPGQTVRALALSTREAQMRKHVQLLCYACEKLFLTDFSYTFFALESPITRLLRQTRIEESHPSHCLLLVLPVIKREGLGFSIKNGDGSGCSSTLVGVAFTKKGPCSPLRRARGRAELRTRLRTMPYRPRPSLTLPPEPRPRLSSTACTRRRRSFAGSRRL